MNLLIILLYIYIYDFEVLESECQKVKVYRTIILPVVLYGCEIWSLTLRKKRRLRRIFGPKKAEVRGEWRKLHNKELNDLYCSPNIILVIKSRRMRWSGHVARAAVLVGKPEGKRPFGKPRRRWEDNIKIDH